MEARHLLAGDGFANPVLTAEAGDVAAEESISAHHNQASPTDVNDDGRTQILDVLLVINYLAANHLDINLDDTNSSGRYYDVNNDNDVSVIDALHIINFLVRDDTQGAPDETDSGAGEPVDPDPDDSEDMVDEPEEETVDDPEEDMLDDPEDDGGDDVDMEDGHGDDCDEEDRPETDEEGDGRAGDGEDDFEGDQEEPEEEPRDVFIRGAELIGSEESEEVRGQESDDTLTGGGGADLFSLTQGTDLIVDFDPTEGDLLDVSDFARGEDGIRTLNSLESIEANSMRTTIDGQTALVINVAGDLHGWSTTLLGITIEDLNEGNVFFGLDDAVPPLDVTHYPRTTINLSDGTVAEFAGHDAGVHPLPFRLVSGDPSTVAIINEVFGFSVDEETNQSDDEGDEEREDDDREFDEGSGNDCDNRHDDDPDMDMDPDTDDPDTDDPDTDDPDTDDPDTDDPDTDDPDTDGGTDTGGNTNPFNLQIDQSHLSTEGYEVRTSGIFAVWWDPQAGPLVPGPDAVFELLNEVRNDVTTNLGLGDPPNVEAGYFFNVFVHRNEDDRFPTYLGNGVGFEANTEFPDLAMPVGLHDSRSNVLHEGFHVFQTSSMYEVVDTNPDAPWIVEASAEWYQAFRNSDDPRSFIVAGSPYALPHLSWWYTPGREPEGVVDDNGWLYGVREYAMSSFLYYLTNIESVDPAVIAGVYATNSDLTAQEYIFNEVGGDNLREMFADWAAKTAAGLDYLTAEQVDVALNELNAEATPSEIKNNILELDDSEADGTFTPEQELTPGGWAYNSIKINNNGEMNYSFDILGNATGSGGAASHFEARVAVVSGQTTTYYDVPMIDNVSGQFVLNATAADSEIYLVIASTPDQLTGTQTYDYEVNISTDGA